MILLSSSVQAFDEAISDLDTLGEDSYKDSALIMQVGKAWQQLHLCWPQQGNRAALLSLSANLTLYFTLTHSYLHILAAVAGQPHPVDIRDAGQQARVKHDLWGKSRIKCSTTPSL